MGRLSFHGRAIDEEIFKGQISNSKGPGGKNPGGQMSGAYVWGDMCPRGDICSGHMSGGHIQVGANVLSGKYPFPIQNIYNTCAYRPIGL